MTRAEAIVYVQAQAVAAQIALAGMLAANAARERRGEAAAYPEQAFAQLADDYCISHNAVLSLFQESMP